MSDIVDVPECDMTESPLLATADDPSIVREAVDEESDRLAEISSRELKAMIEALLFVSHDPLSLDRLVAVLGDVSKTDVRHALHALCEDCDRQGRGLQLVERAGGFQLVTRQDYAPWIRRLDKTKSPGKLSRSALETLAIIAYKQPLVRAEIEDIRRVETAGVLRTLLERKLIRIVGRKEVPGRPILYGTTKQFLEQFGLKDLSELPPLREISELGEAEQVSLLGTDGAIKVGSDDVSTETLNAPPVLGSEFSSDTPEAVGVHEIADSDR
jgi:segregation and condensation protein B